MSQKLTPREQTRIISSIAHAPPPPPDHAYLVGQAADTRPVTRSPYSGTLTSLIRDGILYAYPTAPLPLHGRPAGQGTSFYELPHDERTAYASTVPKWYRPDPDNQPQPVPLPQAPPAPLPETNPAYLKAEKANPSGRWFRLPHKSTALSYYRRAYGQARTVEPPDPHAPIFLSRDDSVYVQFPTSTPADPPPLPPHAYERPPEDRRLHPRDPVPDPQTVHAYLYPYAPRRCPQGATALPNLMSQIRCDTEATGTFYIPFPAAEFPPPLDTLEGQFVQQFCRSLLLHEDTPEPQFPQNYRYQPVRVERQERREPPA